MTNHPLKEDFKTFERVYFLNDLTGNNYYAILDISGSCDFICESIDRLLSVDSGLDRQLIKEVNSFRLLIDANRLTYSDFRYFRSAEHIIYAYLLLFLLKTFSSKFKDSRFQGDETHVFDVQDYFIDRNDFVNMFIDHLFKFLLFNEITHNRELNQNKAALRLFGFRFVGACNSLGFLDLKELRGSNRHYKLLEFSRFPLPLIIDNILYLEKFKVYIRFKKDPFIYNRHFSSVISIAKQAKYSNSTFKTQSDQVDALTQRSLFIDRSLLLRSFELLLADLSVKSASDLQFLQESISSKISLFLSEGDTDSLKVYHSKLSTVLTLVRIKTLLDSNFDNLELFVPFMLCFRGRVYELGSLSFTFYKEFRYCAYSGYYDDELEQFHPISSQINGTIDSYFHFFKKFHWFDVLSIIRKRTCVWLFVSIGFMQKSLLGKKVHISAFVLKGIELWESDPSGAFCLEVYEKIEYYYLIHLISELRVARTLKKWIFWKDATASCFQHLLLILGGRDADSYSICNLNSTEYWFDPYMYLITDFFDKRREAFEKNPETSAARIDSDNRYRAIFSRKRLKRVIMTESYGAGFKKLSSYFYLNIDLADFSAEDRMALDILWTAFFKYLSNENVLFAQSSKAIVKGFKEKNIAVITNPDSTGVDYSCFVIRVTQGEYYVNGIRHTYRTREITPDFDKAQFETSLRANFVQTQDAVLARRYILSTRMWTVHDCFSIDFLNITFMVAVTNGLMNGEFYDLNISTEDRKPIYSIFIIV